MKAARATLWIAGFAVWAAILFWYADIKTALPWLTGTVQASVDVFVQLYLYATGAILQLAHLPVHTDMDADTIAIGSSRGIRIIRACTGAKTMMLFGILLAVLPLGTIKQKLTWIPAFLVFLTATNIARFCVLTVWIHKTGGIYFRGINVHDILNEAIYAYLLLCFAFWLFLTARNNKPVHT